MKSNKYWTTSKKMSALDTIVSFIFLIPFLAFVIITGEVMPPIPVFIIWLSILGRPTSIFSQVNYKTAIIISLISLCIAMFANFIMLPLWTVNSLNSINIQDLRTAYQSHSYVMQLIYNAFICFGFVFWQIGYFFAKNQIYKKYVASKKIEDNTLSKEV